MTITQTITQISRSAKERKDSRDRSPQMSSLDHARQGDVYIWSLPELPAGCELTKSPAKQLAPGETQGSRHVLDSLAGVRVYRLPSPNELQGPILVIEEPRVVTHPEHAHVTLDQGVYLITYQRAFADDLRRVRD